MSKEKLMERARDELFSHINRCGVLQAEAGDQKQWMDETIDYIAERYPDLSDADLNELHAIGVRFCKPAIPHGANSTASGEKEANPAPAAEAGEEAAEEEEAVETEDATAA